MTPDAVICADIGRPVGQRLEQAHPLMGVLHPSPWVGVPSIRAAWLLQSPDGRSYLCILTSDGSVAWTLWAMPCG